MSIKESCSHCALKCNQRKPVLEEIFPLARHRGESQKLFGVSSAVSSTFMTSTWDCIAMDPVAAEPWETTSVLASSTHNSGPYRPETRRCRSGTETLKDCRLHKCISCEGKRSRGLCARCNASQVSFVGALPRRELLAVAPSGGSYLSTAARSYATHNSISSLCAAVSLFLSASTNSHTALPAAPPGCCITLLLELREGGGSWEENRTAVLLCFSWMSFHAPSAAFSPHSE